MDDNNKNFILAIVLSMGILIVWQYFYALPKMEAEKARKAAEIEKNERKKSAVVVPPSEGQAGTDQGAATSQVPQPKARANVGQSQVPTVAGPLAGVNRDQLLAASPRVPMQNDVVRGSVALKGGRIDDLVLKAYTKTLDPKSGNVVLLSPSGSKDPFYVEHGWVPSATTKTKLPDANTLWSVESGATLAPGAPITLKYDNGEGVIFRRIISLDKHYMFTVRQEVENNSKSPVTLHSYALVARHDKPHTLGFFVLHEGLVGVLGEHGLKEIGYADALAEEKTALSAKSGWMGITDKYWAATVIPPQGTKYFGQLAGRKRGAAASFQADYLLEPVVIAPGSRNGVTSHVFAGAKKSKLVDEYADNMKIDRFDLLIDWGWFYFITKPLFGLISFVYGLVGNFGVAILIVTVIIKGMFFPLASKSYTSMAKIKKLQPEMEKLKKRYEGDSMKLQQAMMELYKKEQVNPLAGCLPVLIQIPVFFALYKVLFVTIEMRHAPFFGWIKDLSAPDPTSIFNLFGLLPYSVPAALSIGIWPLLMGITMWVQMQLNPQQADPIQQKIFNWMPVIFTFLLASFPAGLVIYWAWNNLLSILQQYYIMRQNDVEVPLLENMGVAKLVEKFKGQKAS